ncbi:MAG: mechanosensitive ion channel family protein [Candidatus Omnitrophica bacterium]|nr:mechanosensitive ion channel family protein [Candidatus Omnitrophota bacterium]
MNFSTWNISPWIMAPLVFLVWVLALGTLKKIVFTIVRKIAARTKNTIDDLLIEALDLPVQLLVYVSGVLAVHYLFPQFGGDGVMRWLLSGFKVICIIGGVIFADTFAQGFIRNAANKVEILKTSGGIVQGFLRVVIIGLGILILLDTFGVSITPIIASLGIGSLAVALALQPTLENFFSGIQLLADKPVQVGQLIRLESGEEGTVQKISWRSTWIALSSNNTVVIPNKLLVNSRVTNYHYPDPEVLLPVEVMVGYKADLDQVERVTLEVARDVLKTVDGGIKDFEPVLRFDSLGERGIHLNVALRARHMSATHLIRHVFIKDLMKRYAAEGIMVPYPTRLIVQEK